MKAVCIGAPVEPRPECLEWRKGDSMVVMGIAEAKRLAYAYRKKAVAIFWVEGDQFGFTSYGMDRASCDNMGKFADEVYRLVQEERFPSLSEI